MHTQTSRRGAGRWPTCAHEHTGGYDPDSDPTATELPTGAWHTDEHVDEHVGGQVEWHIDGQPGGQPGGQVAQAFAALDTALDRRRRWTRTASTTADGWR